MPMIRGIPDDHLVPRIVASDEIAALEGNDPHRGGLGGDMLFDISAATSRPAESGRDYLPVGSGTFPGTRSRRHPGRLADRGRLHRRSSADDFVL